MTTSITIRRPDDFHCHFREGEMMEKMVSITAASFARALAMPNLSPPLTDAARLAGYMNAVLAASPQNFAPMFSLYLTAETTPETIWSMPKKGVLAAKLYIRGATTNSAHGVPLAALNDLYPVFHAMEERGMVLCVHGEDPDAYVLNRERAFLPHLRPLVRQHPRLRIVMEHVTDLRSLALVRQFPNVAATITVHHLLLTTDDVIGGMIRPHHHCMPCAKRPEDRDALRDAALGGNSRFFLGTDSAPHLRRKKEYAAGCAGVFTAPVAMPLLAGIFEEAGRLDQLEHFTSVHGANFYKIPWNAGTLTLVKEPWQVPDEYAGVVPFRAGETLDWKVA